MTGSRLAALLDQATPGVGPEPTWTMVPHSPVDLKLDGLVLDMARLLVDMAAYIDRRAKHDAPPYGNPEHRALLARFAALDEKAGGA